MVTEHRQHTFALVVDQHTAAACQFPSGAHLEVVQTREQPTQAASADGSRNAADVWKMSRAISHLHCDAFFFPTSYTFCPLFCRTPTVIAFHDATAEQHPELIFPGWRSRFFWNLKSWLARRRADRLITVSEDARAQLAAVFQLAESAIDVITEGPDPCFRPLDPKSASTVIPEAYQVPTGVPIILYVGGISPHKNLKSLLLALVCVDRSPWHLVLVGDYQQDSFFSCYAEVVELARSLGLADRVTFTGYVPDEDLVMLYNVATMLVLPSLSEGFGLPVVEAMTCGCPVAVSDRNSLPEIVGPAGLLFNPLSPTQIAEAITRLLLDESLRAELRSKGLQRAELFSWKKAAEKTVRIIEEVVARGR
jgi:glycosyltransferase involved in cell wall biosynthesis